VNSETGEIYAEAGDELDGRPRTAGKLRLHEIDVLDIDHVNVGAYIRNTLRVDKNTGREDALFDIYRVMRPGEPPTIGFRRSHVQLAVLRQRALRPVGRRPREDEHASRPGRVG
jgi:hypothetical protein